MRRPETSIVYPHTLSALSASIWPDIEIIALKRMSVLAVGLPSMKRGNPIPTHDILTPRYWLHVMSITTTPIPTKVVNRQPFGDSTFRKFVCGPMRSHVADGGAKHAVTMRIYETPPVPTGGNSSKFFDLRPKPFFQNGPAFMRNFKQRIRFVFHLSNRMSF